MKQLKRLKKSNTDDSKYAANLNATNKIDISDDEDSDEVTDSSR